MNGWDALDTELAQWSGVGRTATLWWRDDDATGPSAALDRLLALRCRVGVPLTLAVIPAEADPELAARLSGEQGVATVQHGFSHANHAPAGDKKAELGAHRAVVDIEADLARGRARMDRLFTGALPVLVPPWNRIAAAVVARLPRLGLRGLSSFGPRKTPSPAPGLRQVNTHVDLIDWRGSRGFVGPARALAALTAHLAGRRAGTADLEEPTGILSHHLVQDEPCWNFVESLFTRLSERPDIRIVSAETAFGLS